MMEPKTYTTRVVWTCKRCGASGPAAATAARVIHASARALKSVLTEHAKKAPACDARYSDIEVR